MKTIENTVGIIYITYSTFFRVLCSVAGNAIYGEMDIRYTPDKHLLEFEDFERFIESLSQEQFTAESFCDFIYQRLFVLLGPKELAVRVLAKSHSHGDVEIIKQGDQNGE